MVTIQSLKQRTRSDMRDTRPRVYYAALLFIVIVFVFNILTGSLTGYTQFSKNLTKFIEKFDPALLMTDDAIEEFVEEHTNEIMALYPTVPLFSKILAAVISVVYALVHVGFNLYGLKVSRREQTSVMDIFSSFEFFGKVLVIMILQTVFIFLWSLLFVFPGIIAAYRYSQSYYVLYDHPDYSPYRCLRESSMIMRGHKMHLLILQLSFIGWLLLSAIVTAIIIVPVLSVFVMPYFSITGAHFYNTVSLTHGTAPEEGTFGE